MRFFKSSALLALSLLMASCRSTSHSAASDILTLETSAALEESCRRETVTASLEDLVEAQQSLADCLGPATTLDAVKTWTASIGKRIESNWPKDFLSRGSSANQCLFALTVGVQTRYMESLSAGCNKASPSIKREIAAVLSQQYIDDCFDFVNMTADGCFVVKSCDGATIDPKVFGISGAHSRPELTLCSDRIQKIHRIKDPGKANLLYNYAYVSELTGNQSSNRITYGPPNCHGVAQASVGGVLDHLRLESIQHARLSNQTRCETAVNRFFDRYKTSVIQDIPMSPGGVMINMKYADCSADDCGKVALWVDDCRSDQLDLSVFIDGMCVMCWEKKLAAKGLKRQPNYYSGKQLMAGCVLTTEDHSVMIVGRSREMCFFYEATSPYGPPQIRAVPCAVVNQKFSRQYCPEQSGIPWSLL